MLARPPGGQGSGCAVTEPLRPVPAGRGCSPGALEALGALWDLGADLASVFPSERRPTVEQGAVLACTVFLEPRGEQ